MKPFSKIMAQRSESEFRTHHVDWRVAPWRRLWSCRWTFRRLWLWRRRMDQIGISTGCGRVAGGSEWFMHHSRVALAGSSFFGSSSSSALHCYSVITIMLGWPVVLAGIVCTQSGRQVEEVSRKLTHKYGAPKRINIYTCTLVQLAPHTGAGLTVTRGQGVDFHFILVDFCHSLCFAFAFALLLLHTHSHPHWYVLLSCALAFRYLRDAHSNICPKLAN